MRYLNKFSIKNKKNTQPVSKNRLSFADFLPKSIGSIVYYVCLAILFVLILVLLQKISNAGATNTVVYDNGEGWFL